MLTTRPNITQKVSDTKLKSAMHNQQGNQSNLIDKSLTKHNSD